MSSNEFFSWEQQWVEPLMVLRLVGWAPWAQQHQTH